jgi:ferredoxin-NADP reductase
MIELSFTKGGFAYRPGQYISIMTCTGFSLSRRAYAFNRSLLTTISVAYA